jgi:hypothetical protein
MASRDITTIVENALDGEVIEPFFAVEMFFDTQTVRTWTGVGEATIDGNTYTGTGELLGISQIEETTLTGVPSDLLSLALQTPYQGRVCNIYFGVVNGNTYSSLTEIFSGFMDEMNIDEGPDYATIELKVENKLVDLERARVRRYTSEYQKSKYPNDKGFDFVEAIQGKPVLWGRA